MQENNKISDAELKHKFWLINNEIKLKEQEKIGFKDEFLDKIQVNILKQENKVLKKALELACETYWNDCGLEDCPNDECDIFCETYTKCKTCPNGGDMFVNEKGCCWVDYFRFKAKEIMKSE